MLEKTGMPNLSRFVISATRVIPAAGSAFSTRARVSSGDTVLWVSLTYDFLQGLRIIGTRVLLEVRRLFLSVHVG